MKLKKTLKKLNLKNNLKIISDETAKIGDYAVGGLTSLNWGDALNYHYFVELSEVCFVPHSRVCNFLKKDVYFCIGSSVGRIDTGNAIIWGTGFMSHQDQLSCKIREIRSVRGPLTRNALLLQGYEVPEVYGDPVLLYPFIWNSDIHRDKKIWELGVIKHFRERDVHFSNFINGFHDNSICEIDITSEIHSFVEKVSRCKVIVSSSLHGLICAQMLGIPYVWLKLTSRPLGDGFKFFDYLESVGLHGYQPVNALEKKISPSNLPRLMAIGSFGKNQLINLIDACPFATKNKKTMVINRIKNQKAFR